MEGERGEQGEPTVEDGDSTDDDRQLDLEGNTLGDTDANTTLEGMDINSGENEKMRKMMQMIMKLKDEANESNMKLGKAKSEKETLMQLLLQQQSRADALSKKRNAKIEIIHKLKAEIA